MAGREILTIPLWFSLLFNRGFKILWLRYIESSSISDCFWRESSEYYGHKILTHPFCFQIPPGEGVQNIMAALHITPSFTNSQREAQNSMAVKYWHLQMFQIPSGGEGGFKISWIRYIKPAFNFYCYRRGGSKTL